LVGFFPESRINTVASCALSHPFYGPGAVWFYRQARSPENDPAGWGEPPAGEVQSLKYAQIQSLSQYPTELQDEIRRALAAYRAGDFAAAAQGFQQRC